VPIPVLVPVTEAGGQGPKQLEGRRGDSRLDGSQARDPDERGDRTWTEAGEKPKAQNDKVSPWEGWLRGRFRTT
jgi:hypothetical protein